MSRAAALALLLAAACGGPPVPAPRQATPEPATPVEPVRSEEDPFADQDPLGIDWSAVGYASDAEALAIWERLGLDGSNFEERLSYVPEQPPALREAMAKAILREGNFVCPATATAMSCETDYLEFPELGARHQLADPCLRRELALWALGELDDDTLNSELAADLIALAGLPPPEDEINRAAFHRTFDPQLRMQMLDAAERAGNEQLADEMLGELGQADLEEAALKHHIDGAVYVLGVEGSLSMYLAALGDTRLRAATRGHVATELGGYASMIDPNDPNLPAIIGALEKAQRTAECNVAAAASYALEIVTDRPYKPSLGKNAKDDAYARALCIVLHRQGNAEEIAQLVGKDVVIEERFRDDQRVLQLWVEYPDEADANRDGAPDVPEADADGDGDPATWVEVQRVPRAELAELDVWQDLGRALPTCTAGECKLRNQEVWFRLRWKKAAKGRLVLDTIERREIVGSCEQ